MCDGQSDIDFKLLGYNSSAEYCSKIAERDSFCGYMIIIDFTNNICYCRGVGKEKSCSKSPVPNGSNMTVYQAGI